MRALFLVIGLLIAVAGFAGPSQAGLAELAAPQAVAAQPVSSGVIAAHAADDDCVGECMFCGHPNSCGHCGSVSMTLSTTVPLVDRPEAQAVRPPNDSSRALARASGPYRPPRT
jgi:hypothetical protein